MPRCSVHLGLRTARYLLVCALGAAGLFAVGRQAAADDETHPLQLEVFINDTPTNRIGAFAQFADGRLAATRAELADVGVKAPGEGKDEDLVVIDPAELSYRYDEPQQKIFFSLKDDRRVRKTYDARGKSDRVIPSQPDIGAVLNYSLYGGATKSLGLGFSGFTGANASLDARVFGPYGTFTQTGVLGSTTTASTPNVLRLDTTWTYSDPNRMVSYRAGDTIAGGLAWTRPIRLGGLQVQRNFALRPDLVTMPLPSFSGSAAVPSTVDVYINNVKSLSQPVAPGPFQLTNLPLLSGGGTARLVVQDAAGREIETSLPFFTSPTLLREGLTDYTLEAGYPRLSYAIASDSYLNKPVASGSVRHGFYDWLTLEGHGEGGAGLLNAGGGMAMRLASWGVLSLSGSASRFEERFGYQGYAAFDTQLWGVTLHAGTQRTFGDYRDLSSVVSKYAPTLFPSGFVPNFTSSFLSSLPPKALDTVQLGFQLGKGSIGLGYIHLETLAQPPSQILNLSYSRPIFGDATFSLTAFTDLGDRKNTGIFAGISIPLGESTSIYGGASSSAGRNNAGIEASRSMKPEPGSYGWHIRDNEGAIPYRSAGASYRSSVAEFSGDVRQDGKALGGTVQVQGAIATMGGGVFLSNRIDDAFAVVDAGIPGVDVLYENRPAGKTNSSGKLLIPGLRSYQKNQVAIDARGLPLNAEADTTQDVAAPADRAGVVVRFGVKNDNDSAVVILNDKSGKPIAVGSEVKLEGSEEAGVVGYDGRAFLKGLKSSNTVVVTTETGQCSAKFSFTPDEHNQVAVGPVSCQ